MSKAYPQRYKTLYDKVVALYETKNPARTPWVDWVWPEHVPVVVKNARRLAEAKGARVELAMAAALLHDIADVKMKRWDAAHAAESMRLAAELLEESGYTAEEVALIVEDALRWHSGYDGRLPDSLEGKILAAADGLAHIQTDFYLRAAWEFGHADEKTLAEVKAWALPKMERDFRVKICFDDVREAARADYQALRSLFLR